MYKYIYYLLRVCYRVCSKESFLRSEVGMVIGGFFGLGVILKKVALILVSGVVV